MENKKYEAVIGLEVHVELKTNSKMFCSCSADYFGKKPNTYTCPVCLGLPGALPVPNKLAIEWCQKIGAALNCEIQEFSKFDRKNYFYPDLPKGYQISQYDQPFAINGSLKLKTEDEKTIRIRRVHMEEDTAKLIHQFGNQKSKIKNQKDEGISLIDFNRSGVPLVEIVTEPDFNNAQDVKAYLQKLQQIVRFLDVSNADMERGEMRLEPNISLREVKSQKSKVKTELPDYKVEVKNINSFKFVEKAIDFEIKRQIEILESGKKPIQETRGWDEDKQETVSQRVKEEASDYRYFPEPDIPPLRFTKSQISNIKSQMPNLPDQELDRIKKEYSLPHYDAEILTRDKTLIEYFEEAVRVGEKEGISPKAIANELINKKINIEKTLPAALVAKILSTKQKTKIDKKVLDKSVDEVLNGNQRAVEDFKKGKESAIMFLVGQVMRSLEGQADLPAGRQDASEIKAILIARIK